MATSADRIASVRKAIEEIRSGRMVVVVDDEDRENEGDLTMAADLVTPEAVNFMARHGRGLICLSLTSTRVKQLGLSMMPGDNRSPRGTAFTVSIDARENVTTGISARERAQTIRVAVAADASPNDIVTPGHIFPLRAKRGGVLVRSGHTEASVDLTRLAGRAPAGVICEIMRDDGEMARMPDLEKFASEHHLHIVTVADLIDYRLHQELLVRRIAETTVVPRLAGLSREFRAYLYATDVEDTEYVALVLGELKPEEPVLVRVQTASTTRDVFGMGGDPPATALRMIEAAGRGVLVYVVPRNAGGLICDFNGSHDGCSEQKSAAQAADSRMREFGLGAQILAHLGVHTLRLITNHPRHIVGLEGYGLHVVENVPLKAPSATVVSLRDDQTR